MKNETIAPLGECKHSPAGRWMRKIIDALRLRASGLTLREIGASLNVGHTTIRDHLKRCELAGLSWPLPEGWSESDLERRLFTLPGGETRRDPAGTGAAGLASRSP